MHKQIRIQLHQDFFNKLAKDIRSTYFPNENHGTTENPRYWQTSKTMEDFSNGCINYTTLINSLVKSTGGTEKDIVKIVDKYIIFSH